MAPEDPTGFALSSFASLVHTDRDSASYSSALLINSLLVLPTAKGKTYDAMRIELMTVDAARLQLYPSLSLSPSVKCVLYTFRLEGNERMRCQKQREECPTVEEN